MSGWNGGATWQYNVLGYAAVDASVPALEESTPETAAYVTVPLPITSQISVTSCPTLNPPEAVPPRGSRAFRFTSYPVYTSLTSPMFFARVTLRNVGVNAGFGLRL